MASRVNLREQEEYDEETEDITINGTSAVVKVNLPSKSKLSQWCQISKKEFPVYSVAFLDRGDYSKHIARVTVDGVQAFGSASKKIRAEAAAAYKLLSGVRLLEGDAVEVGLQTDFYAGEQVPSNKIMVSNNTKRRRQERMDQFNANTSLAVPGALAHRLQCRSVCNAAPPASGPQNGRRGLERCLPLGFWAF